MTILDKLSLAIEKGKINQTSPYPPDMKGEKGADELIQAALEQKISPQKILNDALIQGMTKIGEKFSRGEAYIPNMLISAKAMNAAMRHLDRFFLSGNIETKGTAILGTVEGDLHDIGKKLVGLVLKGAGWKIVDLGTDVSANQFINALKQHKNAIVGMSALLTTTMLNMKKISKEIKKEFPATRIFIGGAPVSNSFAEKIAVDGYFADPFEFSQFLKKANR